MAYAWLPTEKRFPRIDGHGNLWALAAMLGRQFESTTEPSEERVAYDESSRRRHLQLEAGHPEDGPWQQRNDHHLALPALWTLVQRTANQLFIAIATILRRR